VDIHELDRPDGEPAADPRHWLNHLETAAPLETLR
jgi:hypothetical protein